jgi:signal transduction histidine kinase
VELSAYRIAQEALTNVTKHASGACARLQVDHGEDELTITVADDGMPGPVRPTASGGLGIAGMRERAGLLGGTVTAMPGPDRGFTVIARLPTKNGAERRPTGTEL